jgi:hypothetical protein
MEKRLLQARACLNLNFLEDKNAATDAETSTHESTSKKW